MTRRTTETKLERLNRQTPGVAECAWPGCGGSLEPFADVQPRVGILCIYHADLITDAVLEGRGHIRTPDDFRRRDRADRERRRRYTAAEMRGQEPGFVYFLQVGERVKIGYSVDVKRRMRAYPPGCKLLAVEPGSPELEQQRHREFAGSLLDGREWFRPDRPVLEHAERVVAQHGDPSQFAHHYRRNQPPLRVRRSV